MANKIQATMSTEIALDTLQAGNSIKRLTQLVSSATSAWKAQEAQLKSAGDTLGAAQAKYDGLGDAIKRQQAKIESLKREQSDLKGNTAETAEQYLKYQRQIDQATAKLASMESQQQKAKSSVDYYKSGLAGLQQQFKQQNEVSETYIKRLQAEGKESEANEEKVKHLKSSIENLTKQYKIQEDMLQKVADKSGKTSSEYLLQKKRLDETATSLAHAKTNMDKLNDEIAESERSSSLIHRLKDSFVGLNNKVDDTGDKTSRLKGIFSATFAANVISNAFTNALGTVKGMFDQINESSSEYVKYQQTMNATWLTLTGNAEDGKKMVDMTNEMAQAAANSTEMVDGMNQKFYAVTHNIDLTKQQTQAILTLQDAFGQTDAAVENFSVQWSQMIANGKVSGQDMLSIVNTFPEMKQAIKDVAAEQLNISNMTTEQFAKLQSEGKITSDMAVKALLDMKDKYKDATENFAGTIGGMERTINSRMPAIIAAFKEPIMQMKNPFMGKISEWVADKGTEDKFKTLGEHSAKGLETISNAFAKVFNLGDGTDKLNSFMDKMIEWVDKTSDKIAKNAPKIASFFVELKKGLGYIIEIGKAFGEGAWEATKGIVEGIAGAFKTLTGNSKKSKEPIKGVSGALGEIAKHKEAIKTVGKLFVAYFAAKKVANGVGAVVKGVQNLSTGLGVLKTGIGNVTSAFGTLKAAAVANPFLAFITGVTLLVVGFVELYKHNKKFRDFCDGIAKSVTNGIGSAIKWLKDKFDSMSKGWKKFKKSISDGTDNVVKSIKNGAKKVGNFFVGVGKTIKNVLTTIGKILIFANPVVLGFALMYKENAKFRKFVKGIVNIAGDLKKGLTKKIDETKKNVGKTWDNLKKDTSKTWDGIKDDTHKSVSKLAENVKDTHDEIHKQWSKTWNKSKDFLSDRWDDINKDTKKKFGKDLKGLLFDNLDAIENKFQEIWNGIRNGFSDMWDGLKQLAGDGINAVIKIPNDGIDGINSLIHDFGGPKNAIGKIPKVKFANGTGFFNGYRNAITRPTLATLNDGHDSPETNNQEMVILPNGKAVLPQGRNAQMLLPAGSEVLNASELAMLAGLNNRQAFAKGTGFWSKIWNTATNVAGSAWNGLKDGVDKFTKMLSFITDAVAHPIDTLSKKFNPNSDGLDGMFKHLGNALYKKPVENAKNWWKELWNMANEKASPEVQAGAIGDDYQFKNRAADSGADPWGYFFKECVSFVASRLSNQGVNARLFSHLGNGNQWLNARVPHSSTPRPGMVAVYAKNGQNHVSTVSGVSGDTFSGEEYNYARSHAYHAFSGRPVSMVDTFLDFGVHVADKAKEENSPLRKLIKGQVGGMFDWIAKMLAPLNMASSLDNPQGGSVERWRSYVERALKTNGIEPTGFRISKILATIQRESNGNPNAINNWDSNAMAGHPSIGLMQTIGPTFEAYKHAGHNNIRNGYDNLLAAINYIKHRYGTSDAAFNRVAAYGYANGGLVSKNGVYELAEGNMPEYVIPTDIAKRGRAWQLLSEAVSRFAGEAPQDRNSNASGNSSLAKLEAKFDTVISLLTQLVANGTNPIEVRNIIDGRSVSNGLAPFMSEALNRNGSRNQIILGGANIR
ncbi:tape measure protein [Streptococcus infantarius]|uniref:tape measure protein n=1 Tax=Streptococcus infantarius TaxID=102684 RepID=UPI0022E5FF86|nr:tape measure protein [Streptococcus infantarius]